MPLSKVRLPLDADVADFLLCVAGVHAEHYSLPLLVPADSSGELQGELRILNETAWNIVGAGSGNRVDGPN